MSKAQAIICPYCGETQAAADHCRACGGLFEPLSRQATHNEMGPWFIRSPARPFQPGCSYETLIKLLERGQVDRHTLLRGPSTKQFWTIAKRVPGVAHLLGFCHQCDAEVNPGDHGCPHCGVPFGAYLDRNHLGLPEIRPLPWEIVGATADTSGAREQRNGGALRSERGGLAPQRGLSSFATDQELLGTTTPPYVPGLAGLESPALLAPAALLTSSLESRLRGGGPDSPTDSAAFRAMQTSHSRQQQIVRLLMAIIAALAIVLAIVLMRMARPDGGSSRSDSTMPQRAPEQSTSSVPSSRPAASSTAATVAPSPAVSLPPQSSSPESPNPVQSPPSPSSLPAVPNEEPAVPSGEPVVPPLSPGQPP